jgi:predicted nuclease with TOPRIM domain
MKKYFIAFALAIALAASYFVVKVTKKRYQAIEQNEVLVDSLMTVVEVNKIRELQRDEELKKTKDSLSKLNNSYKKQLSKNTELKQQLNEKINSINSYDSSDITKFWSERYNTK